jgi:hypothetical protein
MSALDEKESSLFDVPDSSDPSVMPSVTADALDDDLVESMEASPSTQPFALETDDVVQELQQPNESFFKPPLRKHSVRLSLSPPATCCSQLRTARFA